MKSLFNSALLVPGGAIALIAVVAALLFVWQAYVFSLIWLWHVVPRFGLPQLGILGAIGILCLAAMLRSSPAFEDRDFDYYAKRFLATVLYSLALLLIAWIAA